MDSRSPDGVIVHYPKGGRPVGMSSRSSAFGLWFVSPLKDPDEQELVPTADRSAWLLPPPKNAAAVAQTGLRRKSFPTAPIGYRLSAIGYLLNVAALLHSALGLVLARLQRLFDGHFAG
jgi:hypothetical protein